MRRLVMFCSAALLFAPAAFADPFTTMDQVGAAIMSCWKPPAEVKKSSVTLRFGFKMDGSLLGPPRPTSINVQGDDDVRKDFVSAAISAVESCTPVELAPDLAEGIGGQVFTMEFATPDRDDDITSDN